MAKLSKKTIEIFILVAIFLTMGIGIYLLSREPEPATSPEISPSETLEKTIRSNDDLNQAAKELDETNIDTTIDMQLDQNFTDSQNF